MDFFELVEKRHSARAYKPDAVEDEKLGRILEAARLAPTAANRQAFKIFVIKTEANKEALRKIYEKDWFVQAPYILGICVIKDKSWVRRDNKSYGDVDAAIVMDHIILAAVDQGLGTCWIGAFDPSAARTLLELDETLEPIAFTPLGYEQNTAFKKVRKPMDELVIYK